jgi:hypothetical protein
MFNPCPSNDPLSLEIEVLESEIEIAPKHNLVPMKVLSHSMVEELSPPLSSSLPLSYSSSPLSS